MIKSTIIICIFLGIIIYTAEAGHGKPKDVTKGNKHHSPKQSVDHAHHRKARQVGNETQIEVDPAKNGSGESNSTENHGHGHGHKNRTLSHGKGQEHKGRAHGKPGPKKEGEHHRLDDSTGKNGKKHSVEQDSSDNKIHRDKPKSENDREHQNHQQQHHDSETETIATDIPATGDMPVRAHLHPVVKNNQ